jgi:16S rRNA (cytosine1402-N4)-methyltransferase
MDNFHKSVLLKEAVEALSVRQGKKYIDATLGGGGHTKAIIQEGGKVLGIDKDYDALFYVKEKLGADIESGNLTLAQGNFASLQSTAKENGFEKVDGIIFDLGFSSHQIDTPERGFSYLKEGPLDMRMDRSQGVSAEYLVNVLEKEKLYEIFKKLGEEIKAESIARAIESTRRMKAIKTTSELVSTIAKAYGMKGLIADFQKARISQRVFQALRIAVNNELENIRVALPQAVGLLNENGALAVISFHSLEDRIVKESFKDFALRGIGEIVNKKPILASLEEIELNSRAKSAKLRVFRKK